MRYAANPGVTTDEKEERDEFEGRVNNSTGSISSRRDFLANPSQPVTEDQTRHSETQEDLIAAIEKCSYTRSTAWVAASANWQKTPDRAKKR